MVVLGVLGASLLAPRAGEHLLVGASPFAPPGTVERLAVAAGGDLVASTTGFTVVASSADPEFAARLYAAGALFVIDAAFAAGCVPIRPGDVQ